MGIDKGMCSTIFLLFELMDGNGSRKSWKNHHG
jgi:hypothetical protein